MVKKELVVGLALGSGGARGWAHIGVLKALTQIGVHPKIIAGSSAGAFVGAAYACGRIAALEDYALSLTKVGIMKHLVANYSFGSEGGLLEGQKLMEEIMVEILGTRNIEDMPLQYAAVATDVHTGREVWIRHGPLFTAVRASMAVPALVSPIKAEGKWLMDGALVNPVPVSVCKALGADVVIAVNLNKGLICSRGPPLPEPKPAARLGKGLDFFQQHIYTFKTASQEETLRLSMFDVALRSIDIMQECITRARLAGEPPEVYITPRLGHLGLMEFHRAATSIQEGYDSTLRAVGHLEAELPWLELNLHPHRQATKGPATPAPSELKELSPSAPPPAPPAPRSWPSWPPRPFRPPATLPCPPPEVPSPAS